MSRLRERAMIVGTREQPPEPELAIGERQPSEDQAEQLLSQITNEGAFKLSQADARYRVLGGDESRACQTCRWLIDRGDSWQCAVVGTGPDRIWPLGVSARFEAKPQREPMEGEELLQVAPPSFRETPKNPPAQTGVMSMLTRWVAKRMAPAAEEHAKLSAAVIEKLPDILQAAARGAGIESGFRSLQDEAGNWWWLGMTTNNLRDRHETIFSAEAHREYVAARDAGAEAGKVMAWHTPGTEFAEPDGVDYVEHDGVGFLLEWGPFHRDQQDLAEKFSDGGWAMSHTFVGIPRRDEPDVFAWYRILERGPLPRDNASNSWTGFGVNKREEDGEMAVKIDPSKRAHLVKLFGEQHVQSIETDAQGNAVALRELNLETREGETPPAPAPAPVATPPPDPAATPAVAPTETPPVATPHADARQEPVPAPVAVSFDQRALEASMRKVITEVVDPDGLAAVLEDHAKALKALRETTTDLGKTDDEKIAAAITPQGGSRYAGAHVASEDDENNLDRRTKEDKALAAGPTPGKEHPVLGAMRHLVGALPAGGDVPPTNGN